VNLTNGRHPDRLSLVLRLRASSGQPHRGRGRCSAPRPKTPNTRRPLDPLHLRTAAPLSGWCPQTREPPPV